MARITGVADFTIRVKLPSQPAEVHCAGCWLYERRYKIAEAIGDKLAEYHSENEEGIWDYQTCYFGCWKRDDKRRDYDLKKSSNYYWRVGRERRKVKAGA
jgi:hypothetical protein